VNSIGPARAGAASPKQGPIALLCAGGALPFAVADAMRQAGREPLIVGMSGIADPGLDRLGARWLALGQLGKLFALLRRERCAGVVLIGAMQRPSLRSMRIDAVGWSYLFDFLEDQGFPVLGAGEVAPELLAPEGRLGKAAPAPAMLEAATRGFACLDAISPFDVGQALICVGERIVAIEGAEGTDGLIERAGDLVRIGRLKGREALLLKGTKIGQSLKVDLPTIGPRTIERAAEAGLAGIVVEAGRVLVIEVEAVAAAADAAGLFLVGVKRDRRF